MEFVRGILNYFMQVCDGVCLCPERVLILFGDDLICAVLCTICIGFSIFLFAPSLLCCKG